MVKVSVVIPVYNVENYLEECLDSIVNQTLKDIEIICVDDGSTDGSLDILNEYAEKDNRFQIISQKNQGQAVARNKGMKLLKGEYFCFMDADDILDLKTFEHCYNISKEKSLDFVMYKLINFEDNGKFYTTPGYDMYVVAQHVKDNVFNYKSLGELIFNVTVSPVNKLFNTEFILNTNARFPEGTIFEDNLFFWRIFFQAERLYFIDEYYYKRRRHDSSTTGDGNEKWLDAIEIYNKVWDIFKEFGHFDQFKIRLYNNKITFGLYRLNNIKKEYKELFFQAWKSDLNYVTDYFIDFSENLNKENKQLLDWILNAENYNEFNLMRSLSLSSLKINELEIKISEINNNLNELINFYPQEIRKYEQMSSNLNEKNENLNEVNKNLNEMNENLKKEILLLSIKNQQLEDELNLTSEKLSEFSSYKEFSENVISSNSWKITKPLRNIRKRF